MGARQAGRLVGGVAVAGAAALAWGGLVERRWYATRTEELAVLRRPGRLRVLFFSDLHLAPGQDHRTAYVRRLAEQVQPDVVVSGGDNLEHPEAIEPVVALHRDVLAVTGATGVAVLGAHDRYGPTRGNPLAYFRGPSGGPKGAPLDTDRLVAGLRDGGWAVLENATESVATGVGPVQVLGLDDPHIDRADLSVVRSSAADPDAVLRLGLVHAPYLAPLHAFDAAGFDVVLAGHTHGGQVAVPFWGALVSNCDLPPAQARGTSVVGVGTPLHVSAGLGHSIYAPVRFACRPELSVLDLVPAGA